MFFKIQLAAMTQTVINRSVPILGVTFSIMEIENLSRKLLDPVNEAAEIEVRDWDMPPGTNPDDFHAVRTRTKNSFAMMATINGAGGEQIIGDAPGVFSSPNMPDRIVSIYIDSNSRFRAWNNNREPRNRFSLFLDFTKPPLFDLSNTTTEPTPNQSKVSVTGDNENWVASVFLKVQETFANRKNNRFWLHRGHVYDAFVLIGGLPIGFLAVARASPAIDRAVTGLHPVVSYAVHIYVLLAALFAVRAFFSYTKWAWPTVELLHPQSRTVKHRKFWFGVVASVFAAVLYDLMRFFA